MRPARDTASCRTQYALLFLDVGSGVTILFFVRSDPAVVTAIIAYWGFSARGLLPVPPSFLLSGTAWLVPLGELIPPIYHRLDHSCHHCIR